MAHPPGRAADRADSASAVASDGTARWIAFAIR